MDLSPLRGFAPGAPRRDTLRLGVIGALVSVTVE